MDIYLLAMISLFGAMSPGPDFAIVTRFALSGSRRAALMATLGVATAVCIHVTYCILGVGLFLKSSPILFRILQIIGSIYLGYLGVQLLISKKTGTVAASGSLRKAFVSGFFTNLLNPKATLFILSLLTQFVTEKTPFLWEILYGLVIVCMALIWFIFLSFLMTHKAVLRHLQQFQKYLSLVMGIILIGLALYVICCD